jgi:hypothetical protein
MKKVIIYDDDELSLKQYKIDNSIDTDNYDCILINKNDENIKYKVDFGLDLILLEKDSIIELDPTTMKKIYKYNKTLENEKLEKAIKRLDREKKKKKKQLTKIETAVQYFINNIEDFSNSSFDKFEYYCYDKYSNDYDYYD